MAGYLIFIALNNVLPPHIKHLILCYLQLKVNRDKKKITNSVVNSLV